MRFLVFSLCVTVIAAYSSKRAATVKPWQSLFGSTTTSTTTAYPIVRTSPVVTYTKPLIEIQPVVKTTYTKDAEAPILRSESSVDSNGFKYVYETGNGISAEATGQLKKVNDVNVVVVQGQYQYPGGPNGERTALTYVADENGYQPKSDLLPTSPPMPVAIVQLLEFLASHVTEPPKKL